MNVVVTSLDNRRSDFPQLDITGALKGEKNKEWMPVFNRKCRRVVLTGNGVGNVSMVRTRGCIYESVGHRIDEVRISGVRCSVHTLRKVGSAGNKTIVDIVFALDPSNILRPDVDKEEYVMNIEFPFGFSPMCYVSKKCEFQYLAAEFEPLGLVATDVTPVSFSVMWGATGPHSVHVDGKVITGLEHRLDVENLKPST